MDFESEINLTNAYYKEKKLALFSKRPTPIKIVKVDKEQRSRINEAYFEKQSTTDYNGIYKGRYVDFEAKECRSTTSFPLANIPHQQIEHLKGVIEQGGLAFFLIRFTRLDETYLYKASDLIRFIEKGERASLPLEEIRKNGRLVKEAYQPRYDFLPLLDDLFPL